MFVDFISLERVSSHVIDLQDEHNGDRVHQQILYIVGGLFVRNKVDGVLRYKIINNYVM